MGLDEDTPGAELRDLPLPASGIAVILLVTALVLVTVLVTLGRSLDSSISFATPSYTAPDLTPHARAESARPADDDDPSDTGPDRRPSPRPATPAEAQRWLDTRATSLSVAAHALSTEVVTHARTGSAVALAEDCRSIGDLSDDARRSPPPGGSTDAHSSWSQAVASLDAASAHCSEGVATGSRRLLQQAATEARVAGQLADSAVAQVRAAQ